MEHFCTLFDYGFLPQGLALHASLRRHCPESVLWILCTDTQALESLRALDLPGARIVPLDEVEDEALLAVKPGRTRGEYCWTLTSSILLHLLRSHPEIPRLTYVDADVWFSKDPRQILSCMDEGRAQTMITAHDYDPEHDQSVQSGKYCVQFVPFRNSPKGLEILEWWRIRCLEWCFNRQEPGRFGDQKYLDEWIRLFGDAVMELSETFLTMAPWNSNKHASRADRAILFHFHGLRLHEGMLANLWRQYAIPEPVYRRFYLPYLEDLAKALGAMAKAGMAPRLLPRRSKRLPDVWRRLRRQRAGTERWRKLSLRGK